MMKFFKTIIIYKFILIKMKNITSALVVAMLIDSTSCQNIFGDFMKQAQGGIDQA